MLKDVIDGLKLVADGIESIKTIADAVNSGKDYIKRKHPKVQKDLRLMIEELRKSLLLIKRASAVLTNFRFAISTDSLGGESNITGFTKIFTFLGLNSPERELNLGK